MTATLLRPVDAGAELWHEELGGRFDGLVPEPLGSRGILRGRVDVAPMGDVAAYRVVGSPQVVRRSPAAAASGPERLLKMCLQVKGTSVLHQGGRELSLRAGQLAVYDTSQAYGLRLDGAWECAVMTFPSDALAMPAGWVREVMSRTHDASTGPGLVLRTFVETALAQHHDATTTSCTSATLRFGDAGLALLASTLSRGPSPSAAADLAGDARRMQVIEHVRRHLLDPSLSHASVAAALGMSPRSLDRLYELEPCTVAGIIRAMRLEGARRELADPRSHRSTIGAVAARWCFPQPAHFSRAFKAQFGLSPREVQRQQAPRAC